MAYKRSKSRGRDLKHTETQAGVNVSRYVTNERGRTDGGERLAISAASPGHRRRFPRTSHAVPIIAPNGERASMIVYFVDPATLR